MGGLGGANNLGLMSLPSQGMAPQGAPPPTPHEAPRVSQQQIDAALAAGFERHAGEWPYTTEKVGHRIQTMEANPVNVRHDIMTEKALIGRVIGSRGTTLQALKARTSCEIFILDKEGPPPGFAPTERVIVLIGGASVVGHATAEINECLHGSGPFGGGGGARYAPY